MHTWGHHGAGAIGEYKIRDVNDEINKLMREKSHWEKQILKLGGPDYYVRCAWARLMLVTIHHSVNLAVTA